MVFLHIAVLHCSMRWTFRAEISGKLPFEQCQGPVSCCFAGR